MWLAYRPSTAVSPATDRDDLVGRRRRTRADRRAPCSCPTRRRPGPGRRRPRMRVELGRGRRPGPRGPTTDSRSMPWPTSAMALTAGCAASSRSRYSPNDRHAQSRSGPSPWHASPLLVGERRVGRQRRRRVAAVADDLGRHALGQRVDRVGIGRQREVGVRVHVDEARARGRARRRRPPGPRRARRPAGSIAVIRPPSMATLAWTAGAPAAVDDGRPADEQVGHGGRATYPQTECSGDLMVKS